MSSAGRERWVYEVSWVYQMGVTSESIGGSSRDDGCHVEGETVGSIFTCGGVLPGNTRPLFAVFG
jgi:hypothetical protein